MSKTAAEGRYPHMCRDGHPQIGYSEEQEEMCPACYERAKGEKALEACERERGDYSNALRISREQGEWLRGRATTAERERDDAKLMAEQWEITATHQLDRAESAERRLAELIAALEKLTPTYGSLRCQSSAWYVLYTEMCAVLRPAKGEV